MGMSIHSHDYRHDDQLRDRHFLWGRRLFATDVDGMLLEHNGKEPIALIEYKYRKWDLNFDQCSIQIQKRLADRAGLPFFVAVYGHEFREISVYPINNLALTILPKMEHMTEREWAGWLYRIRGEEAPAEVLARLHDYENQDPESGCCIFAGSKK